MKFSRDVLSLDVAATAHTIESKLRDLVQADLRRRGAVVGISGGIDSAVVAALATRALGAERVLGLLMPERASSPESLTLGRVLATQLDIEVLVEDLGAALEGFGCYARQRDAIRSVFPEYQDGWRFKVTLPPLTEGERLNVSSVTVERPSGALETRRLPAEAYRQLVAATNFKQRARKTMEYFHADCRSYAVLGTPNRLEYDQGFFVKCGDGAADVKPIAHLYKTQVYQLAAYLDVPELIRARPPSTDTYPLSQTQEEFYFALPYARLDLCLWAYDHGVSPDETSPVVDLAPEQVLRVYRDIEAKRRVARYLHSPPLFIEPPLSTKGAN